ncbi:MAG: RecQ family ATP-dependent DNA helicase [Christensenellaceae bacterium]|nr:RecQ family ATP-dependent DNA helicase [Christensenellaceae bacterium]
MNACETLKHYFGYDEFREGQETLVNALLAGRDALGVMPTGAGKSICYQVPALMMAGVTLVVSPLISLMADQVAALRSAGIPAAYLNSSLSPSQLELATRRAREGQYRIIYIAPERLEAPSFLDFAKSVSVSMIAVDEAHCVSQWGQDFRPVYLRIADFVAQLPVRPVIGAFTATATERVREDIIRLLGLREPVIASTGFDRPNLYFEVLKPKNRYGALTAILSEKRGEAGVVYCATRKTVEEVCGRLQAEGFAAARYHAGLSDEERRASQEDFQYDRVQVMVATNAFGMGIDKSNVRYVIHYNMPRSMEAYYQEAGRAGRDGDAAECVLLYSPQDIVTGKWMIQHGAPNEELSLVEQNQVRRLELQRLNTMIDYCTKPGCLRRRILNYFGDAAGEDCGDCGGCTGGRFGEAALARRSRRDAKDRQTLRESAQQDRYVAEEALFERLRAARLKLARANEVPAYAICSDKSLADMARRKPGSRSELLGVYGIGQVKADRYGEAFLEAIRAFENGEAMQLAGVSDRSDALYERLRSARLGLARVMRVPAYVICSDRTLKDMARRRPRDRDDLLKVYGIGEVKADSYGEAFLEVIREYESAIK